MAFEPKNLTELLEWRQSLPGGEPWKSQDYLEELGRLGARGLVADVLGSRVLDGFGLKFGERQPVPAEAFNDYRLGQEIGTNHGVLRDRLFTSQWVDLRFPDDTRRVWQTALEAGEIRAPRAASPPAEAAESIPDIPTKAGAPAPASAHPPRGDEPVPAPIPDVATVRGRKKRPAPQAAAALEWLDRQPEQTRRRTPTYLARRYCDDHPDACTERYAFKVFSNPEQYRDR